MEHFAATRPADVIGTTLADFGNGQCAALFTYIHRLPAGDQGHGENFIILAEGNDFAIRRNAEIIGEVTTHMDAARLSIEIG